MACVYDLLESLMPVDMTYYDLWVHFGYWWTHQPVNNVCGYDLSGHYLNFVDMKTGGCDYLWD